MQSTIAETNNVWGSFFFFFAKYSRFYVDSANAGKHSENIFWFWDNFIWIGCVRHSLLLREYLSLGVNMLTNSLKISVTTKTEFFGLTFFISDRKIWQKYCRAYLTSVSDTLTCWLFISVLTRGFLGNSVTPLFAAYNFKGP